MRKIFSAFVFVLLLGAPYAQAKMCSGLSCNFIDTNWGFENGFTDWTSVNATISTGNCYSSNMANFAPVVGGVSVTRNQFQVDADYVQYKVTFRAWLVNDNNNFYDEMKVRVTNDDTGAYEEWVLHGSNYTNGCGYNTFYLSNNYDNARVTVKFYIGNYTLKTWQIDDVGFFGTYY